MSTDQPNLRLRLNDRYVAAAVAWVRALLAERVRRMPEGKSDQHNARRGILGRIFGGPAPKDAANEATVERATHEMSSQAALAELNEAIAQLASANSLSMLQQLSWHFGLSEFEEQILLLCLAFELDSRVGMQCGLIQQQPCRPYPTFGLAMVLFEASDHERSQSAPHWTATLADGPLRRQRLIDVRQPAGTPLLAAELRLEETILHYLRGVISPDWRLRALVQPVAGDSGELSESQQFAAARLRRTLINREKNRFVVQLTGGNSAATRRVALAGVRDCCNLFQLSLDAVPVNASEVDDFIQLWQRDSSLFRLGLLIDAHQSNDSSDSSKERIAARLASQLTTPVLFAAHEPFLGPSDQDVCIDVSPPTAREQFYAWLSLLEPHVSDLQPIAGELARQFCIDRATMTAAVDSATSECQGADDQRFRDVLWRECRQRTRPRLEGLAQRINVKASMDDIVLSSDRKTLLEQIRGQVQSRWRVYDEWGVAATMNRGLGISALFAGESGTGKTMAAEVLANRLQLDLYRVDLSQVVNKYIGETEKHLRRLFDEFESCGAILFFDECDALFGKRSEVKDSHDRYANIEINYLLQRLESYRGLAILATNNRKALDKSFLRRLRFVVTFDMPTPVERECIWRRLLPPHESALADLQVPVAELDYGRLAKFEFSGGSIHNVALGAAFIAAARASRNRVSMKDVLTSARYECLKLERPIVESDFYAMEEVGEEVAA